MRVNLPVSAFFTAFICDSEKVVGSPYTPIRSGSLTFFLCGGVPQEISTSLIKLVDLSSA